MRLAVLTATAILCAGATMADAQIIKHAAFTEDGVERKPEPGKDTEVGIDSVLGVRWNHPELLKVLADRTARTATSPLVDEINLLLTAIQSATVAQQRLAASKVRFAALQAADLARSPQLAEIRTRALEASTSYGRAGLTMIEDLEKLEAHRPAFRDVIDLVIRQGDDYDPVITALTQALRRVQDALADSIASGGRVRILMTATLIDSAGRATALHLPGYDAIAVGAPTPFARFNLALDQRAMSEVQAAAAFAPVVTDIRSGKLTTELKRALDDLPAAFQDLRRSLTTGPVATEIDKTIGELKAAGGEEASALITSFQQLKAALNGVDAGLAAPTPAGTETLEQTATRLLAAAASVRAAVTGLPDQLQALVARAEPILKARNTETTTALVKTLNEAAQGFLKQHQGLIAVQQNLDAAYRSLSITNELTNAAEAVSRTAREVQAGTTFDTALDLSTVRSERHPGDRLHVTIDVSEVAQDGAVRFIEQDRRSFRLEQRGWYAQTRGALLFVEPKDTIEREISYQPTPAVGFQFRYGAEKKPFLNHVLAPSIGVSLALLDFADGRDFELGVGLNATMVQDLLWVGGGRNVQAKANYWYFGVNPLALSGLFRR